jgi:hypothetical protein
MTACGLVLFYLQGFVALYQLWNNTTGTLTIDLKRPL